MQLFYTSQILSPTSALLDGEEAAHALRVLRLKEGQEISFTDGKGVLYQGKIAQNRKDTCLLEIISSEKKPAPLPYLHLAIAPTKNIDRIEWLVEKGVELGVSQITLLLCQRSERKIARADRLQKIALSAMKQSLAFHLPLVSEPIPFKEFLKTQHTQSVKLIAHCMDDNDVHIKDRLLPSQSALVLIGPEGDFTAEEVKMALAADYLPCSLGPTRLRTETAGLYVCNAFNFINS